MPSSVSQSPSVRKTAWSRKLLLASDHAFAADAATAFLTGKPLSIENIEQTALLATEHAACLSDQYASADYRKHLVKTEVARALSSLSAA